MKKASKILLIIGGIFAILAALMGVGSVLLSFLGMQGYGWYASGAGALGCLLNSGVLDDVVVELFTGLGDSGLPAEMIDTLIELYNSFKAAFDMPTSIIMLVVGVFTLILSFVALVSGLVGVIFILVMGILGLTASGKKAKKGKFIANFVLGGLVLLFFGSSWLSFLAALLIIVGSILGLIALKKQPVEEEQPVEGEIEEVAE